MAWFMPVFGDEAYYYIWSLHPQLSYFDHPPMVSWLILAGHLVFPAGYAVSLRIPFLLLSFFTSLIWLKILNKKNFSDEKKFLFFLFVFLNPLLGLGSVAATPDVPLVFFWSLSYFFFNEILSKKSLLAYAGLGISLGLGFCSKYHIVIFVISGLLYLLLSRRYKELKISGVLLTVLLGGVFCSPVVIWNAQNKWQSFAFQLNHGFGEDEFSWSWPLGYLVAQSFLINPFFLFQIFKDRGALAEKTFSLS
ncbi:MAG: glycosyltransferase family 39 protein, partial [Pseudobdellovibrio sp.]